MEQWQNNVVLRGTLKELPQFSHENHGRSFYKFFLEVQRLSGALDLLPVMANLSLLEQLELTGGSKIRVAGQIRSHNFTDADGRHLSVFVYAEELCAEEGEDCNQVCLHGAICRTPTFRRTPLGREISDLMLAVPRGFRRADYLPCILWGRTAQQASLCHTGDEITIDGRLQSRIYSKYSPSGVTEHTTYEISALSACFPDDPE